MGRKENRKKAKVIQKKMTKEQFDSFKSEVNRKYIEDEVEKQIKYYQKFWNVCLVEAFKKNGLSESKAIMILDDVEIIMRQKIEEKKNKPGIKPVIKGELE